MELVADNLATSFAVRERGTNHSISSLKKKVSRRFADPA
jgi:hypothetical protein